jgi:hypothetical protein
VITRGLKSPEISSAISRLAGAVVDEQEIHDAAEEAYVPVFQAKVMRSIIGDNREYKVLTLMRPTSVLAQVVTEPP